jgi:hypothetical protein
MGAQVCAGGSFGACSCTSGATADGGVGSSGGDMAALPAGKIVFLTSTSYSGDLRAAGRADNGLTGANNVCATAAAAAGMGGAWRAWLSDSTHDAIDLIADVGPWYLRDGTKIFNNKANLQTTALSAIARDENGHPVAAWDGTNHHYAWTGTLPGGRRTTDTCLDWTNAEHNGDGAVGSFDKVGEWTGTASSRLPCDGTSYRMHLYCLEQ